MTQFVVRGSRCSTRGTWFSRQIRDGFLAVAEPFLQSVCAHGPDTPRDPTRVRTHESLSAQPNARNYAR